VTNKDVMLRSSIQAAAVGGKAMSGPLGRSEVGPDPRGISVCKNAPRILMKFPTMLSSGNSVRTATRRISCSRFQMPMPTRITARTKRSLSNLPKIFITLSPYRQSSTGLGVTQLGPSGICRLAFVKQFACLLVQALSFWGLQELLLVVIWTTEAEPPATQPHS